MSKRYFKALVPFSSGTGIYNPADKEPSFADEKLVNSWIEAGYAVGLNSVVEEEKQEAQNEVVNEPIEPIIKETKQEVAKEEKTPQTEEKAPNTIDYDAMPYPQLKKAAKAAGIKKYNTMKQADLIKVLKGE